MTSGDVLPWLEQADQDKTCWNLLAWQGDMLLQAFDNTLRFFVNNECTGKTEIPEMEKVTIIRSPSVGSRVLVMANLEKVCLYWVDMDSLVYDKLSLYLIITGDYLLLIIIIESEVTACYSKL